MASSSSLSSSSPRSGPKPMSAIKRVYLVAYNALSAALWLVVLSRTAQTLAAKGHEAVYPAVGEWTQWTQTLAGLEILHSVLGVVRAPLMTTLMQVSSRFALVWGAVHFYPAVAASPAYSSMLLAWSTTEVIRYTFFALSLSGIEPSLLQWFRYSGFYVLYPVGISSELWELFLALTAARKQHDLLSAGVCAIVMATYLPGAPKLYGHMMRQRRKVLGGGGGGRGGAQSKKE